MHYEEFKRQVGKAGLTLRDFAELLNKSPFAISNYAKVGAVPDHLAVIVVLMGQMTEAGLDFRPEIRRLALERKKSRGRVVGSDSGES